MKELLPIGTIIKLKEVEEYSFMIMGYYPIIQKKSYEYMCVEYPVGLNGEESCIGINSDIIEEVIFEGYSDERGDAFREAIPHMLYMKKVIIEELQKREK